ISCVYSPQKQMGRPKKRRRDEAPADDVLAEDDGQETVSRPDVNHFGHIYTFGNPTVRRPDIDFSGVSELQVHSGIPDACSSTYNAESALSFAPNQGNPPTPGFDLDANIDPSLWDLPSTISNNQPPIPQGPPSPAQSSCTCLSIMYLSLSDLQNMTTFAFPAVIPSLRQAMSTTSTMLQCEKCPQDTFSAMQNVQSLTALFSAIAERFHKVLRDIDAEAARLEQAGAKKPFRIGDNNAANMHLHTGTIDCPMGFDIELEPNEWKRLAKRALKTEVLGGGSNPVPLSHLVEEMSNRQSRWHTGKNFHRDEVSQLFGGTEACAMRYKENPRDAACVRMIDQIRGMLDRMGWD
ncbi:hypothetical protein BDV95DRAFT_497944, partial [Massariosphaeria phaeospora]